MLWHEANTALLDILVDNSLIIPSLSDFETMVYKLNYRPECPEVADFAVFASYIARILNAKYKK